jgi:hypothetical protein
LTHSSKNWQGFSAQGSAVVVVAGPGVVLIGAPVVVVVGATHREFTHLPLQQSPCLPQNSPTPRHGAHTGGIVRLIRHRPLQHWKSSAQNSPKSLQHAPSTQISIAVHVAPAHGSAVVDVGASVVVTGIGVVPVGALVVVVGAPVVVAVEQTAASTQVFAPFKN